MLHMLHKLSMLHMLPMLHTLRMLHMLHTLRMLHMLHCGNRLLRIHSSASRSVRLTSFIKENFISTASLRSQSL